MTAIEEKFTYFKQKQAEITALYNEVEPKKQALIQEAQAKAKEIDVEYTAKIDELLKPLNNLTEKYKAELKAWAGITDGEKTNVLEMLMATHRLTGSHD